jgi:probable phosphoglycerate mutase
VSGRWQGQGDALLSPWGEEQRVALAARVAQRLAAGWRVEEVIASDLTRAARTGRTSFPGLSLDAAWREADVGAWEGLTRAEVAARFPDEVAALAEGRRDVPLGGGESLERFWARVDGALDALRARLPAEGRAVVFTHGGVIGALVAGVLGKRAVRPSAGLGRLANTSMTTLHFDAHHPHGRVLVLNDNAHLGADAIAAEERRAGALPVVTLVSTDGHEAQEFARLVTSGAPREGLVEALRALVADAGGTNVTLRLEPRALHAAVVLLAQVAPDRPAALAVSGSEAQSHVVLDARGGAALVDHAIHPHKL